MLRNEPCDVTYTAPSNDWIPCGTRKNQPTWQRCWPGSTESFTRATTDESKWGADFAIVGILHGSEEKIEKGVLPQAKRGSLRELNSNTEAGFFDQCARMARATIRFLVLRSPAKPATT